MSADLTGRQVFLATCAVREVLDSEDARTWNRQELANRAPLAVLTLTSAVAAEKPQGPPDPPKPAPEPSGAVYGANTAPSEETGVTVSQLIEQLHHLQTIHGDVAVYAVAGPEQLVETVTGTGYDCYEQSEGVVIEIITAGEAL